MVNLEVVRSRLARQADDSSKRDLLSFAEQAVDQAESVARLFEGVSALILLITQSLGDDGKMRGAVAGAERTVSFDIDSTTAERLLPRLKALGEKAGFTTETGGKTVIFTLPVKSGTELRKQNESAEDSHR
jgi:hypothetical protein